MTDSDDALDTIARAAADLVPALTERLHRYGLGEIEVAHGELRVRVAAGPRRSKGSPAVAAPQGSTAVEAATPAAQAIPAAQAVPAPAVGFFVYADGLGPGLAVEKGDSLGHVEMLGVRHDVRAPRGGTVRNLVAESGEAVEYGQVVVELETAGASR